MVIATRVLKLRQRTGEIPVPIRVFAPEQREIEWACRFEIEWPSEIIGLDAMGVDAVQALELALRMIGAFIYSSDHHACGQPVWEAPGKGYGFPVANSIRDMLVGDDKKYYG